MHLFLVMFYSVLGPSSRHSVPRVLPHVSLLTEQRRNRNETWVPSPTSPMSEQGEASQRKRGNLVAVTSEVWALAQDSNQPETHKDQSTSEYSCPGPQVACGARLYPLAPLSAQGRSRPDPAEDLARPS
uniref:Uncharacterized protein n=1 Tax=Molossus molossus TaxID=27622 RepID=A0A7J8BYI4_MOLMO|nr:hypothetical protein HJG59_010054 [Molossus molossus]